MKKNNKLGLLLMLVAALSSAILVVIMLLNADKFGNEMFIMMPLLIIVVALEFHEIDLMWKEMIKKL